VQIKPGKFYMHEKAMDACVLVQSVHDNGTCTVEWYNLGYTGNPWPIMDEQQTIYMHPDVWHDITELVSTPRDQWNN
jgi:hypothetical protein